LVIPIEAPDGVLVGRVITAFLYLALILSDARITTVATTACGNLTSPLSVAEPWRRVVTLWSVLVVFIKATSSPLTRIVVNTRISAVSTLVQIHITDIWSGEAEFHSRNRIVVAAASLLTKPLGNTLVAAFLTLPWVDNPTQLLVDVVLIWLVEAELVAHVLVVKAAAVVEALPGRDTRKAAVNALGQLNSMTCTVYGQLISKWEAAGVVNISSVRRRQEHHQQQQ